MSRTGKVLSRLYYSPAAPTAFSGAKQLVNQARRYGIPESKVREWLAGQEAYTLHRKVVRKYRRRPYLVLAPFDTWQADLADVASLAQHNDQFKYWLVVIDIFTKFVWVVPLPAKTAAATTTAFASVLLKSAHRPNNLNTDKGTEFVNSTFQALMKKEGINFYTAQNPDTKACFAERAIRTIKEKMHRYLTYRNTNRYIDHLSDFVQSYNNTVHSATGVKPSLVTADNEDEVRRRLHQHDDHEAATTAKYSVGDQVRITRGVQAFRKGYEPGWTREVFTVQRVLATNPVMYELVDFAKEPIKGRFYENETQKVTPSSVYKIERIISTRQRNGVSESLVKWLGYPMSMSTWIRTADIEDA